VHLLSLGYPILGDSLYSTGEAFKAAERLQLHSCMLSFKHPITKEQMIFERASDLII
jgi:tRNA pseudouridine32 synthase/23S rRNA pseudouridine746 synthase